MWLLIVWCKLGPAADVTTDDIVFTVDIASGDVQTAGAPIDTVGLTIGITTENV